MKNGMNPLKLYPKQGKVDQVMSMISTLYFFLFHLAYLYCLDSMNERYDAVTEELEWRIYEYFNLIDAD